MLPLSTQQITALQRAATAQLRQGQLPLARRSLEQLAKAEPKRADYPFQLSRIAYETGDRATCLSWLDKAVSLAPANPKLNAAAAETYRDFGRPEDALAAYDRLIAADRRALKPRADKAHYLQLLGRFDEAETLFRKLIREHPREADLYRVFLVGIKIAPDEPLIPAMKSLWQSDRLSDQQRADLGYALAKAMEDTKQTAEVFPYLHRANALQRKLAPFDEAAQAREYAAVLRAQEGLAPAPQGAPLALKPVFVTGMPRSGTTLVERILAAHSQVTAGGELSLARRIAYNTFGAGEEMRPLAAEAPEKIRRFAETYIRLAGRDTAATDMFTDKSIMSHLIFGLLHHALPGARFIVVHRDPRDIAVSIYKNMFRTGQHRYANDLADIATTIKRFRANVRHWQERLPGVLHEIHYEALVAEPESQSRALIDAAGLAWEDGCLDFHKASGVVKTLSLQQARQPIHRGSAQAWHRYERELQPFIDAWGDEPWD